MTKPQPADATTASFLREVDEHLHYTRMKQLWETYRVAFFVMLAGVFVAVAGGTYYNGQQAAKQAQEAAALWAALNAPEAEKATLLSAAAGASSVGVQVLATYAEVQAELENENTEQALLLLNKIAEESRYPAVYRDLAVLHRAQLLMDSNPAEAETLLSTLTGNNSPFQFTALELQALLASKQNNAARAFGLYERILSSPELPSALRQRATQRLEALRRIENIATE